MISAALDVQDAGAVQMGLTRCAGSARVRPQFHFGTNAPVVSRECAGGAFTGETNGYRAVRSAKAARDFFISNASSDGIEFGCRGYVRYESRIVSESMEHERKMQ